MEFNSGFKGLNPGVLLSDILY